MENALAARLQVDLPGTGPKHCREGGACSPFRQSSHADDLVDGQRPVDIERDHVRGSGVVLRAVARDAAVAYITCMPAGKIAVLDLRTWQLQPSIDLTPGVDGMAWSAAK